MTGQLEGVAERVGVIENNLASTERWDIGVKGALTQLLANQKALQEKVTEMEGHSRCNNIRIYGIPEEAKGTSATAFLVDMIKTQLGEAINPNWGSDLGIERAHQALALSESKGDDITEETLAKLLPWEVSESRRGGDEEQFQQQVCERLKEYRRSEMDTAAAKEG